MADLTRYDSLLVDDAKSVIAATTFKFYMDCLTLTCWRAERFFA